MKQQKGKLTVFTSDWFTLLEVTITDLSRIKTQSYSKIDLFVDLIKEEKANLCMVTKKKCGTTPD